MNWQRQLVLDKFPSVGAGKFAENFSVYTDKDGNWAVIPPGWTVSGMQKENTIWGNNVSLVIYEIPKNMVNCINWNDKKLVEELKENYNQFVWVPVDLLDANGTLDGGKTFNQKFGRRKYKNSFCKFKFNELHEFYGSLCNQINSVLVYGGFYISKYFISTSDKKNYRNTNAKPLSVKGNLPWLYLNYPNSEEVCKNLQKTDYVTSHLIYGAEYDCVLEWFLKSGVISVDGINENSMKYAIAHGNKAFKDIGSPIKTGAAEKYSTNNLNEFIGNLRVRTQEFTDEPYPLDNQDVHVMMNHIMRGICWRDLESKPTDRVAIWDYDELCTVGIRACLCISCFAPNNT